MHGLRRLDLLLPTGKEGIRDSHQYRSSVPTVSIEAGSLSIPVPDIVSRESHTEAYDCMRFEWQHILTDNAPHDPKVS